MEVMYDAKKQSSIERLRNLVKSVKTPFTIGSISTECPLIAWDVCRNLKKNRWPHGLKLVALVIRRNKTCLI